MTADARDRWYRTGAGRPLAYAGLFHLLLLCAFVLVRMDTAQSQREFFEVALAQAPPQGSDAYTDPDEKLRRQRRTGTRTASGSRVDLPSRRMMTAGEAVSVPAFDEKVADASAGDVGERVAQAEYDREQREWAPAGAPGSAGKRGVTEFEEDSPERNRIFEFGSRDGTTGSYRLEWVDGGSRKLLKQVTPQYPPGLNRETVIRLKFRVRPDGGVDRIIPVRKGDPRLEETAIRAFSAWQFEPLGPSSDQADQTGFITFIFKLR